MKEKRYIDYSHETNLDKNTLRRYLWLILGLICVGLAFIGALLPIMPTTIFLILATFFFARSSPRFYNWIMNHKIFGSLIRDWRNGQGIPLNAKVLAVSIIVLTIGFSIIVTPLAVVKVILILIGSCLCIYLITRPTKPT